MSKKKKRYKCEHGRQRSQCVDCGGSSICEHKRLRFRCKECGGVGVCKHGRQRITCKDCGGSQVCEHRRIRSTCKECGGKGICKHDKRRHRCGECNPPGAYKQYIENAEQRGLDFNISFEEYLKISSLPCTYCGEHKVRNGIDRKDSSLDYTINNSVPCCSKCNQMKFTYPLEEFLGHVTKISKFQQKLKRLKGELKNANSSS